MQGIVPRFQPIVDTWQNRVIGFEATVRGVRGESAQALFERAKSQERVVDLDFEARSLALQAGLPMLKDGQRLFLNCTSDTVQQKLDAFLADVPLNRVVLEITEQMPIRLEMNRLREDLQSWCDQGLQVALDDFGHGFTNVEMITELPLSYLKLDKVFAASVHRPKTAETVKWLVRMCQDAGIRFVVEGVETAEQRERLLDLGVRFMQGFYFGYPKSAPVRQVSLGPLS
ncbi:MAG TPA: EAL domain-containing protein [Alicyclobacillus sp.]|nr:EAL domain-containing protein [Alicyclobacillus sp.]